MYREKLQVGNTRADMSAKCVLRRKLHYFNSISFAITVLFVLLVRKLNAVREMDRECLSGREKMTAFCKEKWRMAMRGESKEKPFY